MIHSLFILNAATGDIVIEKHWRGQITRALIEGFMSVVAKSGKPEVRTLLEMDIPLVIARVVSVADALVAQDVPPVLSMSKYYIMNVLRNGLFFLAAVESEVPALFLAEFIHRIVDVLELYLGAVDEARITANFSTVYQVLEEIADDGIPLLSEPNALVDVIKPPSLGAGLREMVTGRTGAVAATLSESATSVIAWRRGDVSYTTNEVFFDIVEEIDCIVEPNGMVAANDIRGTIFCNCRLSGVPDLTVFLNNPSLIVDAGLHPCIRLGRYERDHLLSFVPPDGIFKLMTYRAANRTHVSPVYVRPSLHWRESDGKLAITLATKPMAAAGALLRSTLASAGGVGGGRAATEDGAAVADVVLEVVFPPAIKSVDLVADKGRTNYDTITNRFTWTLGAIPAATPPLNLTGTVHLSPGAPPPIEPLEATLSFSLTGISATGLALREVRLTGDPYRYNKGLRTILRTGRFHIRI